jgi:hypothetical protein
MTTRESFAQTALLGLLISGEKVNGKSIDEICSLAVEIGDTLLEKLKFSPNKFDAEYFARNGIKSEEPKLPPIGSVVFG